MFAILVEMTTTEEHRQTLIDALTDDGRNSLRDEPGTLRFDLHEDSEQAGRFYLIEAYADDDAFKAHTSGAHYLAVTKVLGALREQGVLTSRMISRTVPVFLPRAEWVS